MANANINLNGVDNTRAAFLSVQNRLRQMEGTTAMASRNILRMGFGIVGAAGVGAMAVRQIREVISNIESMPGVPDEVAASVLALRARFQDLATTTKGYIASALAGFANLGQNIGIAFGAMVYGTEAAADALDKIEASQKEALDVARIEAFNKKYRDLITELERTKKASEAAFVFRSVTDNPVQRAKELWQELGLVNQAIETLANTATANDEEAIQKIKSLIELYKQRIQIAADVKKNDEELGKSAREAARILSEGFEDAIFSGKKLSEVVRQLALDLVKMAFRSTITAPLGKALGGFFGNLSLFGGARAGGGPVGANKSYLVGERGPEIFTPSSAGNVISNRNSFGGGSGGGSTYYIDARGADQTGLARLEGMIRQTQASIVPMALGAVMNAKARGSAFYA
jgi:hypothetical protein